MSEAELACIPVVDVREGGAVRHAVDARARARALRDDCVTWLPRGARMLLPAMDALTRRWLQRSHSPYVMDLEAKLREQAEQPLEPSLYGLPAVPLPT